MEETRPRAFVCITGQLSRLELENKEEKLFRHRHETFGVDFDVALVLSGTNHSSIRRGGKAEQKFFDTKEVADYLNTIPGVTILNEDIFVGSENPVINPQYHKQRSADNGQTESQRLQRCQNNIRQFESLAQCFYHMQHSPLAAGKYDTVHRVRDDSGYYLEVPYEKLLNMTRKRPKTIVSSSCQQHGGINDRGSFVSPLATYDYFVPPIIHMYTQPLPTDVRSTEFFLMNAYTKTSYVVEMHQFHMFRIGSPDDTDEFYPGTKIQRFLPGTNFESERGTLRRCTEGLHEDSPRRGGPRCHLFSTGRRVCDEIA